LPGAAPACLWFWTRRFRWVRGGGCPDMPRWTRFPRMKRCWWWWWRRTVSMVLLPTGSCRYVDWM